MSRPCRITKQCNLCVIESQKEQRQENFLSWKLFKLGERYQFTNQMCFMNLKKNFFLESERVHEHREVGTQG